MTDRITAPHLPYSAVHQKIEYNRIHRETVLDLCGQSLLQIPDVIRSLPHLEQLWLPQNALQTLPA